MNSECSPVAIIHLLLWVGVYALALSIWARSWRPTALIACAVLVAGVLDAGYLWPMVQAQAGFPRLTVDTFTSIFSFLWFALLPMRGKVLPANGNGHELSVFIGPYGRIHPATRLFLSKAFSLEALSILNTSPWARSTTRENLFLPFVRSVIAMTWMTFNAPTLRPAQAWSLPPKRLPLGRWLPCGARAFRAGAPSSCNWTVRSPTEGLTAKRPICRPRASLSNKPYHSLWHAPGCTTAPDLQGHLTLECPRSELRRGLIELRFFNALSKSAAEVSTRAWTGWLVLAFTFSVLAVSGREWARRLRLRVSPANAGVVP